MLPPFPSLTVTPDTVIVLFVPALAFVNSKVPLLIESNMPPLLTLLYKVPLVIVAVPAATNEAS